MVHLTTAATLAAAGFSLLAAGRRPHYTVALDSEGDDEFAQLLDCLGPPMDNRYHRVGHERPEGTRP